MFVLLHKLILGSVMFIMVEGTDEMFVVIPLLHVPSYRMNRMTYQCKTTRYTTIRSDLFVYFKDFGVCLIVQHLP